MIESDEIAVVPPGVVDLPPYLPSERAREVLVEGAILSPGEMPQDLLTRVIDTLFSVEVVFGTPAQVTQRLQHEFAAYLVDGYCMLGTPILSNAGRRAEAALSSCAIVPLDARIPLNAVTQEQICSYYRQNMGSGFNLTASPDPVAALRWLNQLSAQAAATGSYDRYIGNMGLLHISHPRIQEFIACKRRQSMSHFNLSVDMTEEFMQRAQNAEEYELADGTAVNARDLLWQIAANAWHNGEPGLVFLERMNRDNPLARVSEYVGTPPCAEMGLAAGETCHFASINLSRFVRGNGASAEIDYAELRHVTRLLTRVLDNAVEYSIPRYPMRASAEVACLKRRIGIGVCGLADMLLACDLPYGEPEARSLARESISFINYTSKEASVELAQQRGSCAAMDVSSDRNDYLSGSYLEEKYARHPTNSVPAREWIALADSIRKKGLRNISTTALPPTGRASAILGTTSSIEPFLSLHDGKGQIRQSIKDYLGVRLQADAAAIEEICREASTRGSFQHIASLPVALRERLKLAKEVAPAAQLYMAVDVAGLYGVVDEAASKTVNLPCEATEDDVLRIFQLAYRHGLKNISIYRDKTVAGQPVVS